MKINYNVTGTRRKELAGVISQITGAKAEYQYMPTCAYVIDFFNLSKEGTLEFSDRSDTEIVEAVLEGIAAAGFEFEAADDTSETDEEEMLQTSDEVETETPEADEPTETLNENKDVENTEDVEIAYTSDGEKDSEATNEEKTADEAETDDVEDTPAENVESDAPWLTISLPLDKVDAGKLTRILEAKGNLIKKALGVDNLLIEIGEDTISFPWFSELPDADTSTAYTHFISALCRMSKEQKRVTATEREVDNEKYAFRCFLLRLGFIGEEYKTDRKILLKNLTGSSAFKSGARKEAAADEA